MFEPVETYDDMQNDNYHPPAAIVLGRFMLPDMSEHPCQVSQIAIDCAIFVTTLVPPIGTEIVAYIDEVGRVEATSGEPVPGGFKVHFIHKALRRERLEQRFKWLAKNSGGATDQRRHARYEPRDNKSNITMPDGRVHACELIDISLSGAAVKSKIKPVLGTYLVLGKMHGRIVRHLDSGFALEFTRQLGRATHDKWVNGSQDSKDTPWSRHTRIMRPIEEMSSER